MMREIHTQSQNTETVSQSRNQKDSQKNKLQKRALVEETH